MPRKKDFRYLSIMGLHNARMADRTLNMNNGLCSELRWLAPERTIRIDDESYDTQDVMRWFMPEDWDNEADDPAYWLWNADEMDEAREFIKKDPKFYANTAVTEYDAQCAHYGSMRQTVMLFVAAIFGEL